MIDILVSGKNLTVTTNNETAVISKKELSVLHYLVDNDRRVSVRELSSFIHGNEFCIDTLSTVYVSKLRSRFDFVIIDRGRGGYRIVDGINIKFEEADLPSAVKFHMYMIDDYANSDGILKMYELWLTKNNTL